MIAIELKPTQLYVRNSEFVTLQGIAAPYLDIIIIIIIIIIKSNCLVWRSLPGKRLKHISICLFQWVRLGRTGMGGKSTETSLSLSKHNVLEML